MSKTRGNVVDPWEMIAEFGADAVRLFLLASSQVWLPKRFDESTIKDVAGQVLQRAEEQLRLLRAVRGRLDARRRARRRPSGRWSIAGS